MDRVRASLRRSSWRTAAAPRESDHSIVASRFEDLLEAARSGRHEQAMRLAAWLGEQAPGLVDRDSDGHLAPAPRVAAELRARAGGSSFVPCFVKMHGMRGPQARALAAVADALVASGLESHVETHVMDGISVSLFAVDHVDLRTVLVHWGNDTAGARLVRGRCIAELLEYAERADAAAAASLPPRWGTPFPYGERLVQAAVALAEGGAFANESVDRGWDETAELCTLAGSLALFWDPKPANYLVPASTLGRRVLPELVHKIDLDWMLTSAPLAHQAVVAAFSDPLDPVVEADVSGTFDLLRGIVVDALPPTEVVDSQLDALVVYHLLRNFASKLRVDATRARPLGALLDEALGRGHAPVPAFLRELVADALEKVA